jgi:hypothetical protein
MADKTTKTYFKKVKRNFRLEVEYHSTQVVELFIKHKSPEFKPQYWKN